MAEPEFDVAAVGEVVGLFDPDDNGPLEHVSGFRLRGRAITVPGDGEAVRVGEDGPHLLEQYTAAVGPGAYSA